MSDHYSLIAHVYDLVLEPLNKGLRGLGMKMHKPQAGMKVLDVCCGTGVHLDLYRQAGCEIHGIDGSPAMLSKARRRLGGEASLTLGDAAALPYGDRTFEKVLCMLALHEMSPELRTRVVGEMTRVLRNDGELLLIDFHPGPFEGIKGRIANIIITIAEFLAGQVHFANSRIFLKNGGLQGEPERNGLTVTKDRIVGGGTFRLVVCVKNGRAERG